VNVARSMLDKDDEHRKEFQRRIDEAEICKKNIEVICCWEFEPLPLNPTIEVYVGWCVETILWYYTTVYIL